MRKESDRYEFLADLHTHTIASGHAVNTIEEMVESAKKKGIVLLGITDHAVTMPGTCDEQYFKSLSSRKKDYDGIEVCLGVELNILDYEGNVDMSQEDLKKMDVVIASIHNHIGFEAGTVEQNTNAIIGAIKNPLINIIGHPDDGRVPLDYERIVKVAKEYGTLLEINNNSISSEFRLNAYENEKKMLKLCKEYEVPVVIGSDAHEKKKISKHDKAYELIQETGYDWDMVMNFYPDELKKYLNKWK